MDVGLVWAEFEESAYVGFRRALVAVHEGLADDERLARPHFGTHIDGAVAEKVVSKGWQLYWPASLQPNRRLGDLVLADGTRLEVRHTHNPDGCFPAHHDDPNDHLGVLVRGRFPHFTIVGSRPIGECKQERFWRPDLDRPCFLVPGRELDDAS